MRHNMERLTNEKLGNSYGLRNTQANVVGAFKDYETFYEYLIAINRLGEYEDTGLSPDGVVELKEKYNKAIEFIKYIDKNYSCYMTEEEKFKIWRC